MNPPKKSGWVKPLPASAAYGVDCELSLVRSKIVETNFKNDEHSYRVNEKASGNQPPHGAESTNPASTALLGVDIISPLC